MKKNNAYHIPVLLKESIDGLNIKPDGCYVDMTFGGGGHAEQILQKLKNGQLFAFDQDKDVIPNIPENKQFTFIQSNYRFAQNFLKYFGILQVDGVIGDLGISSHHLDYSKRGFSFRENTKLDMRMNKQAKKTAEDVLNTFKEHKLLKIFKEYGEIRNAKHLVNHIVETRKYKKIKSVSQFYNIVKEHITGKNENRYLAQVFMALRIEVNDELHALKMMLTQMEGLIKPGGRLVIISYHSLEDRLVKNYIKTGNVAGKVEKDFKGNVNTPFRPVNKKVIKPSYEEVRKNNRARSAKLRIAERTI